MLLLLTVVVALAGAGAVWWVSRPANRKPSEPEGSMRAPTWSQAVHGTGPVRDAMVVDDAVLVQGEKKLTALDRADGRLRWEQPLEGSRKVQAGGGGVAVYSRSTVRLYGLATGDERYAQEFTGDVAVTASTLVVNDCPAAAAQCSITARDMTTGGPRWQHSYPRPAGWEQSFESVEVLGSPMVLGGNLRAESMATRPAPVVLVREGRSPDGTWKVTVRDITTGEAVGGYALPHHVTWVVTDRSMLAWDLQAAACEVTVSAYDIRSGRVGWTVVGGQWPLPAEAWTRRLECTRSAWAPLVSAGTMAVTTPDRRIQLTDLSSGQVRWTAEPGLHALALTDRAVVARADGAAPELVGLDPADGRRRWVSAVPKDSRGEALEVFRVTAVGDRLVYTYYFVPSGTGGRSRHVLRVLDAVSGGLAWVADDSGFTLGAGADWVVTGADTIEDADGPKEIRLYAG